MASVTLLIVGAGRRGKIYADFAKLHPELCRVVGVADVRPHRIKSILADHEIVPDLVVSDWHALARLPKSADAVVISLLDRDHLDAVNVFADLGYDILCEKPMAVTIPDCVQMARKVASTKVIFGVGHVLRYSPYNQTIKEVLDSGAIGEIINIQHVEPVGFEHFAHSYVRGNWGKEADSTFSLMSKSCHDIDILNFYLSGPNGVHKKRNYPIRVSSFGSLTHFKPSKKPREAGTATRCTDCAYEPQCAYSAKRHYLDQFYRPEVTARETRAERFLDTTEITPETIMPHLEDGPFGECVYNGQNDVCDNQVVNIEYASGATASFTMIAFTDSLTECHRRTRIYGSKGQIEGDSVNFVGSTARHCDVAELQTMYDFISKETKTYTPPQEGIGHGGGDYGISRAFAKAVQERDQSVLGVDVEDVLMSHLLVFAAETARKENRVVDFAAYEKAVRN